jgi:hypothetical protein
MRAAGIALSVAALLAVLVLAGCGGGGPTAVPTGLPGVPIPACGAVCASPNAPVACQAIAAPLAALAQAEAAIKAGSVDGAAVEGEISGIQQALEDESQQIGQGSSPGHEMQAVVSALGELGVGLNQNQPPSALAPQLAALDGALANLASACQSAS